MNPVLESVKFVAKNSRHVAINKEKISDFCESLDYKDTKHWISEAPLDLSALSEEEKLTFLLVFNSISFSYWGKPKWTISYNGKRFDGSYGMLAALERALKEDKPILNAGFLAKISEKELGDILRGTVEIPLLKERCRILNEVGNVLLEKFNGNFSELINAAEKNALTLLELMVENFPNFNDYSVYKGKKSFFYKRAQLLISDIYQLFEGKGFGELNNIDKLTACADYKLPMILCRLKILEYSSTLFKKIDSRIEIPKGSEEEIEIRANTIIACELIKQELRKQNPNINSIHINDYLWLLSQNRKPDEKYHLTRTTFY